MLVSRTKKYDEEATLKLYANYVATGEGINELVDSVVPLINGYITSIKSSTVIRDKEEYAINALEKIYGLLVAKTPPDRKRSFTSFVINAINYDILNTRPSLTPAEFNFIEGASHLPYGKVLSQDDVDLVIHYNQLTEQAYQRTVAQLRFSGSEKHVCVKLLKDITEGKESSTNFLALRFGVPKQQVERLRDYVKTVYRASCHNIYGSDFS